MAAKSPPKLRKHLENYTEAGPSTSDSSPPQYAQLLPAEVATDDYVEDIEENDYYNSMMKRYLAGRLKMRK